MGEGLDQVTLELCRRATWVGRRCAWVTVWRVRVTVIVRELRLQERLTPLLLLLLRDISLAMLAMLTRWLGGGSSLRALW